MDKNKFLVIGLGLMLSASVADAAKIDGYRQMILQGEYTIRYDNITPAPRVTNRDKVELFGKSGLAVEQNDYLTNRSKSGVIVESGNNKYEEIGDDNFSMCRLKKNNENFVFTKYKKGDGYEYFGNKKGKVQANSRNVMAELMSGDSYGDADMSAVINALLPDSAKSANMPRFQPVAQGNLPNGLSYEDYRADASDGSTKVVRYYFAGASLTKIAAASYSRDGNKLNGHKCIIKIREFSPVADRKLLVLPQGLEDDTDRRK